MTAAIRWTEPAHADFLGIVEWLNSKNPAAAARVGRSILEAVEMLGSFPHLGKPGRSPDTRELGVSRFPYLLVYSVEQAAILSDPAQVAILRVLHGAMLWPPIS
jgi:toxin ParE1/3/4